MQTPSRLLEIARARGVDVEALQCEPAAPLGQLAPARPSRAVRNANDRRLDARAEPVSVVVAGVEVGKPRPKRQRSMFATSIERRERMRSFNMARGVPSFAPADLSDQSYRIATRAQRGPASARDELAGLPRQCAQRTRWAALAYLPNERGELRPTRTWAHPAARRIVAVMAVMQHEARNTRRRGMHLLVEGFSRGSLCSAFRNAQTGAPVHKSTLYAVSFDARRRGPWDCGAVVALHRSGALVRHQPPASVARPEHVGKGRDGTPRALNQYWLTEKACSDLVREDDAPAFHDWTPTDEGSPPEARGPPA